MPGRRMLVIVAEAIGDEDDPTALRFPTGCVTPPLPAVGGHLGGGPAD
jgi:hypothetical protein